MIPVIPHADRVKVVNENTIEQPEWKFVVIKLIKL